MKSLYKKLFSKKSVDLSGCAHRNLKEGTFWETIPAYKDVPQRQFMDHMWQLKNSIKSVPQMLATLKDVVSKDSYHDIEKGFQKSPMAVRVSPYVISLIDWNNPLEDPLRRQFIPLRSTMLPDHPELRMDSLHEQADSPVPGFTHRYADKALFLALNICPVYCRYCTRSYAVGTDTTNYEKVLFSQDRSRYEKIFAYIKEHPELEDIVVSGGDAYMLKPDKLEFICSSLLDIPHVRRIRIATKGIAVMPMKILSDRKWYNTIVAMVRKGRSLHKEVCVHTHFSHPNEITNITKQALDCFCEDGVLVRNQAVLQRGVNDSEMIMILLARRLGYLNVHSYYVYMHDLVMGVEDLRTSLQRGLDIEKYVRGSTAGFNTPTFVVDAMGGGGKRSIHSYEYYNRETGVSVYTAPRVKPGQFFYYFDPIDTLSESIQQDWHDENKRKEMKLEALEKAKKKLS